MSFINKYDPQNPFYSSTTFIGYSLTGLIVVTQSATVYNNADDTFKGISNNTIVKNYGAKRPVTLSFNPVYLYMAIAVLVIFGLYLKFGKK